LIDTFWENVVTQNMRAKRVGQIDLLSEAWVIHTQFWKATPEEVSLEEALSAPNPLWCTNLR